MRPGVLPWGGLAGANNRPLNGVIAISDVLFRLRLEDLQVRTVCRLAGRECDTAAGKTCR